MQELHSFLNLGQEHMVVLKSKIAIEEKREKWNFVWR